MKLYDPKFVYFDYDESLVGKEVFYADNIGGIKLDVEQGDDIGVVSGFGEENLPFEIYANNIWKFVYYDPNYKVKRAFTEGKPIEFYNDSNHRWIDCETPTWNSDFKYRVKEEMKLKWTDLKVGDVLKHDDFYAMVTAIERKHIENCHVAVNGKWYTDKQLAEWEKVENE